MHFRNDHSKSVHDRSRGMVGERSRNHFMTEQREKKHELESNRQAIRKALNEGFEYDGTSRLDGGYDVRFINRRSGETQNFRFEYEANYTRLESFWWKKH